MIKLKDALRIISATMLKQLCYVLSELRIPIYSRHYFVYLILEFVLLL